MEQELFNDRKTLFAEVLLPLPLAGVFTYRIPFELNNQIENGKRVVVQFGPKKLYTALVVNVHEKVPKTYTPKYLLAVLDERPVVNDLQIKFWNWISDYYMCYPGEVMNAALPSALKLASETKIIFNPDFKGDYSQLNEKEYLLTEALEIHKVLTLTDVSNIVDQLKVIPLIKNMIEKGVVMVQEELTDKYKPKKEIRIQLAEAYQNNDTALSELMDSLSKKAYKQLEALMLFISLSLKSEDKTVARQEITKNNQITTATLNALEKKGIIQYFEKEISRLQQFDSQSESGLIQFSEAQQTAFNQITNNFQQHRVCLLHGVTGSGKTELYIKLIQETIDAGKQVLFLLPEIALTTQIINRLRKYFGDLVGVYHSRYNDFERVEIWNTVLGDGIENKKYKIILGARSSLFLPYNNLGLIIVDEEHDYSYKQIDPAPRYNARDAAIYLAGMHDAKVLLGSATPAIESYYNAKSGKYGLAELTKRYGGLQMPEVMVADLKNEHKKKTMKSHFSSFLMKNIEQALENKEQVILFQNRRGFSLRLECERCDWTPECNNCDVSLIYHKKLNRLKCHYCGYSTAVPTTCPSCGGNTLHMRGFGTEKIEDELPIFFKDAKVVRMDLDTTRSKNAYQRIIQDFEDRNIDILVGTQMVTKGLDFDNVSLVGILNADSMISFPDFRSFERSFQQIAQVSGRAGRKNKRGKVIIQSWNPYHSVIRYAIDNNYQEMYKSQILERKQFKYPPYYRLIQITLKHRDYAVLNPAADELAQLLKNKLGNRIIGPEYPMIQRIRNQFLKNIMVKLERSKQIPDVKKWIMLQIEGLNKMPEYKSVRVVVNVDPV